MVGRLVESHAYVRAYFWKLFSSMVIYSHIVGVAA